MECPLCGKDAPEVSGQKTRQTYKCACGNVWKEAKPRRRRIVLKVLVSRLDKTESTRWEVDPALPIGVGDRIQHPAGRLVVTSIEGPSGIVDGCLASEARAISAVLGDEVQVHLSINDGPTTSAQRSVMQHDAMVYVGQRLRLAVGTAIVKSIMDQRGRRIRDGGVSASSIKRVYCDATKGP